MTVGYSLCMYKGGRRGCLSEFLSKIKLFPKSAKLKNHILKPNIVESHKY